MESAPCTIKKAVKKVEAEELKGKLEEARMRETYEKEDRGKGEKGRMLNRILMNKLYNQQV